MKHLDWQNTYVMKIILNLYNNCTVDGYDNFNHFYYFYNNFDKNFPLLFEIKAMNDF